MHWRAFAASGIEQPAMVRYSHKKDFQMPRLMNRAAMAIFTCHIFF